MPTPAFRYGPTTTPTHPLMYKLGYWDGNIASFDGEGLGASQPLTQTLKGKPRAPCSTDPDYLRGYEQGYAEGVEDRLFDESFH